MVFDKNQADFRDCLQEKVWELATRQLPLDKTLPYVPSELIAACTDWYNFCQGLFADMYENPDRFGFVIDPSEPDWMNKKQAEFYFWMVGGSESRNYEMTEKEYDKMLKKFNPKSIEALVDHHGFVYEKRDGSVTVSNRIYPDMFVATKKTMDCGYANYKVNRDYFMIYCDFRGLANYKRTYEDLHLILSDDTRRIAEQLHDYCVAHKITPQTCNYFFRVEYKHKGKIVYISDLADRNRLKINIGFAEIGGKAFKMLEDEIGKYDDAAEFKAFWHKHAAKKCQNCKQVCVYKSNPKEIFGKKVVICGENPYIRIYGPEEQDLAYIYRLLDLRVKVIDAGISEQFYPGNG